MHTIAQINGATILFAPFPRMETASLGVFFNVGSRLETKRTAGAAHFLEHLLFKGSKHYTYRQIKQEIEGRGGVLNGFTSHEISGYYAYFLKKNLTPTLDILLDMVLEPLLQEHELRKERGVILEEIKMYHDLPSSRVVSLLDHLLWNKHPLGEDVLGSARTVGAITRSDLHSFAKEYYHPANMVISCCGDLSIEEVTRRLRKRIPRRKGKRVGKKQKPLPLCGLGIEVERRSLQQTHVCIGFRGPSYASHNRLVVEILNVILGANMSSRLFEEVRERKGLCYDISTEVRKYSDSGAFIIHLGLDRERIETAVSTIMRELAKIKDTLVGRRELERAKDYFLGQGAMSLERPQGRMFYLAESYITKGKILHFEEIKRKIEAITSLQVRDMARGIFTFDKMCISSIGDFAEEKEPDFCSLAGRFT